MDRSELSAMSVTELKQHAADIGMKGYQKLRKAELIDAIALFTSTAPDAQAPATAQPAAAQADAPAAPVEPSSPSAQADTDTADADMADDGSPVDSAEVTGSEDVGSGDAGNERQGRNGRESDRRARRRSRREDNGRREESSRRTREDRRQDTAEPDPAPEPIADEVEEEKGPEVRAGVLDILPEGYGFLRTTGYLPGSRDVYVSQGQIRKYGLRRGDIVQGPIRPQRSNDKVPALDMVEMMNAVEVDDPADLPERVDFDLLPAVKAEDALVLPGSQVTINRGQRMMIGVPKGVLATEMLADIAAGLAEHNETAHLMVVAIDEAPEEVTLLRRAIPGEVIASAFDRPADDHTQVADLALERAKRLVEDGWDVVVVLHSLTRLAKAWSLCAPGAGRTVTGGLEPSAIHPVKRWLGAGRNLDGEGSLTVITTIDTHTGRPVDEVIADQFGYLANARIDLEADEQGNLTIVA